MRPRLWGLFAVAATAGAMSWVALQSWRPLIEEPGRFIGPALTGTVIIAVTGTVGRHARLPFWAVVPIQVVAVTLWLQHRLDPQGGLGSWIPSSAGMHRVADAVASGAAAINTYAAPVTVRHTYAPVYLLVTGLLVVLAVDLIGCGLRQAPWAGLPIVVALTVPISVLETPMSWFVLVATAILFTLLLAAQQVERIGAWEHALGRVDRKDSVAQQVDGTSLRAGALRIGLATAAGALLLPVLVPVSDGLFGTGDGGGSGRGSSDQKVTLVNPLVDLHADLVTQNHLPLLIVATDDPETGYLRTTVLDQFDGRRWKPSQRDMPAANKVDGALPPPPGLPSLIGNSHDWSITLAPAFRTSWLPAPFPLRTLKVSDGDWRYDRRTMDFASVEDRAPTAVTVTATAVHPALTAARLENTGAAPRAVRTPMTALPKDVPTVVKSIAAQVTADGTTNYEKAVLLQNWFRTDGGFTYSLDPDVNPGSSMDALAAFITTDKVGYCEQYAAAMAIMARTLGIPARVAVGFLGPDDTSGNSLVYTSDTLHAWPEIYFPGSGWVRFEPTPGGRTGAPPAWTQQRPTPTPTDAAAPTAVPTNADPGGRAAERPDAVNSGNGNGPSRLLWIAGAVALLAAAAVPALLRRRLRRRRLDVDGSSASGAVAVGLWGELMATAEDLRIPLPVDRSLREISQALTSAVGAGPDAADELAELVSFLESARYGRPFQVSGETRRSMTRVVESWCTAMTASVSRVRRVVATVAPHSILSREAPPELSQPGPRDPESVTVVEIG